AEQKECRLRFVDHARQFAGPDDDLGPRCSALRSGRTSRSRRRSNPDCARLPLCRPLLERAVDFTCQPVSVFGADAMRMFGELLEDSLQRPALTRKVPDDRLEGFASLAVRHAVLDDAPIIEL